METRSKKKCKPTPELAGAAPFHSFVAYPQEQHSVGGTVAVYAPPLQCTSWCMHRSRAVTASLLSCGSRTMTMPHEAV